MGAPAYEQPLYADMDRAKGLVEAKTAESVVFLSWHCVKTIAEVALCDVIDLSTYLCIHRIDSKLIQPASDAFKRAFSAYPLTTVRPAVFLFGWH